ncbi:MAG: hypothetical protein AAGC81_19595 [Pseudomonadota bacterium]
MTEHFIARRTQLKAGLAEHLGYTNTFLFRSGGFDGSWHDLICNALISEHDSEMALSFELRRTSRFYA